MADTEQRPPFTPEQRELYIRVLGVGMITALYEPAVLSAFLESHTDDELRALTRRLNNAVGKVDPVGKALADAIVGRYQGEE